MLYVFPLQTFATVQQDYEHPYSCAIAGYAGAFVTPVRDGSVTTDFMGWTWCIGEDGRSGWVPDSWCEREGRRWRLLRDYNALELSVLRGQQLLLLFSESGFVMAETEDGRRGWVPDAILALKNQFAAEADGRQASEVH
jgi:hypothetical protein